MRPLTMVAALGLVFLSPNLCAAMSPSSAVCGLQDTGITKEDLKKLVEAKVPDSTIIAFLKSHGPPPNLSAEDVVSLKKAGASDVLLEAILGTSSSTSRVPSSPTTSASPTYAYTAPSYSGDTYYTDPTYYDYSYGYYPYGYYYPDYGFALGFGFPFHRRFFDRDRIGRFDHGRFDSGVRAHGSFHGGSTFGGGGFHGGGGHGGGHR